jgi:hypothetical protein
MAKKYKDFKYSSKSNKKYYLILLPNRNNDSFKNMGGMSGTSKQQIEKRIQSKVNKGLAKEGAYIIISGSALGKHKYYERKK